MNSVIAEKVLCSPLVIKRSVSVFWKNVKIFSLLVPEEHAPLSRCCIDAGRDLNCRSHLLPLGHFISA